MRKITAFYAWQSDTPERFNRHLIRIALRDAAKRITNSMPDVEVIVDYDTAGVPGTPPISDTILKKIDGCDIFIPDVSFVARTSAGKFVPNPNVMTEYGYALCAKTHTAMVPIMNTFFGPPQELPFDMGHLRHPIQYYVDPAAKPAQRRAVRRALSQEFEEKLRLQIAATEPPHPTPPPFPRAEPKDGPARFRPSGEPVGIGWDRGQSVSLLAGPTAWLRVIPSVDPNRKWRTYELKEQATRGYMNLLPLLWSSIYVLRAEDGIGVCHLATPNASESPSVAFAFETGEVWAADTALLGDDDAAKLFPDEIERAYSDRLQGYARFLAQLGVNPPYHWIAGLTGIKGRRLAIDGGFPRECLSETIIVEGTYDGKQTPDQRIMYFLRGDL